MGCGASVSRTDESGPTSLRGLSGLGSRRYSALTLNHGVSSGVSHQQWGRIWSGTVVLDDALRTASSTPKATECPDAVALRRVSRLPIGPWAVGKRNVLAAAGATHIPEHAPLEL